MPWKNTTVEKRREYDRKWYASRSEEDKKRIKEKKNARRRATAEWIRKFKEHNLMCSKCGEKHPACLDFHHPDPSQKEMSVASATGWSIKRIQLEMIKCVVLCSNCHRKHHYEERIKQSVG